MRFSVRRRWLVLQLLTNGLVFASPSLLLLLGGLTWMPTSGVAAILAAIGMGLAVAPIRRRHLFIDASGLVAVRNGYRLCATWDDVAGFDSGRFALAFPVTIMRLHRSRIERLDEGIVSDELRKKIEEHGADRGVQIGLYVADPHRGAFGDLLLANRPDLSRRL